MKRIIESFFSCMIALALIMPAAAPAFAESNDNSTSQLSALASLMIKSPNMADVSQTVTITVFSKKGHQTVSGASVYAIKTSDLVIKAESSSYTSILNDYEALAEAKGIHIGTTGSDGTVTGKLDETGRFMLVATMDGYIPGFSRITIGLAAKKGLNIRNPGSVEVNKPVTFTVTERYSGTPVAGASIYAQLITEISMPPISAVPTVKPVQAQVAAQIQAQSKSPVQAPVVSVPLPLVNATIIKADPSNTDEAAQNAAKIKEAGTLIGSTDDKGQISYTFTQNGSYVLTAVKDDYTPGFSRISLFLAGQKKLGVKSPGSAAAGANVDFFVIERNTGQAVSGAALWALRIDDIKETADQVWEILASGSAQNDVVDKYKGWAQQKGILLGYSNDSGQVSYTFKDTGRYLLAAVMDGYAPGFSRISITLASQKQLSMRAPASYPVGQPVIIKVYDRSNSQPVEQAAVYAVKPKIMIPTVQQSPVPAENGTATQVILDASAAAEISTAEAQSLMAQSAYQPVLIGYTGSGGDVTYTFAEAGLYTLVAVKDGYLPGGRRININSIQPSNALEINALFNMTAGQQVYIRVWERGTKQPVPKAAVYVLKVSEATDTKAMPPTAKNDKAQNEANTAKDKGAFAGHTDDSGQVSYNFNSSGRFLLAAFKDGYEPAFIYTAYTLPEGKKMLYIKSPAEASVGDQINISVFDSDGKAVAKASLYAIKMQVIEESASLLQTAPSVETTVKEQYAPQLTGRGAFLGYTDGNGMLQVKFSASGAFMLLAVRTNYVPAYAKINIKLAPILQPAPVQQAPTTSNTAP